MSRYSPEVALKIESYLNRFLSDRVISSPLDITQLFKGLSPGRVHNLDMSLRAFLNFCMLKGYSEDWVRLLKKAIPKDPEFIDLYVPSEDEVIESLKQVELIPKKYKALWLLCLESGLRLVEALNLVNGFNESKLASVNDFFRYQIGSFRGSKAAYYAYFTDESLKLILEVKSGGGYMKRANASKYYERNNLLRPKYLRKFAFDKMVELGIPESIADFIQGRVPTRVGAKHYMALARQADQRYGRYAGYIAELRRKAGLLKD